MRGEAAAWVDEQLESEVARGQLVRGSSPWGSAPFPTKEAPEHKKQRKRRLVVDYRRVNARVKRSTYYCRQASDVLACAAGSAWFSFVDAVTGFNQAANTRRASIQKREVLAFLTFEPTNRPDDFCYTVDRAFAPGRNRTLRYGKQWLAYVDDLTVRTGKCLDQRILTDVEYDEEIRAAAKKAGVQVARNPGKLWRLWVSRKEVLGTNSSPNQGLGRKASTIQWFQITIILPG